MAGSLTAPQAEAVAPSLPSAIIPNVPLAIIWRGIIVIAAIAGILMLNVLSSLIYFTVQSNAMLIAVFGYEIIAALRKKASLPLPVKGAVTVYILITGLVYNIILRPTVHVVAGTYTVPIIGGTVSNNLLHVLTPLMALLDWLLFDAHVTLRWRNALIWLCYPLGYLGFALIRGLLINASLVPSDGTRYPYGFINVDHIGYGGVAINTVIYGVFFWLLGTAVLALNHWIAGRNAGAQKGERSPTGPVAEAPQAQ